MKKRSLPLDKVLINEPADTKLSEMVLPEEQVLEKLNAVSTAKRLANMVRLVSFLRTNFLHTCLCSILPPHSSPLPGILHSFVTKLRGFAFWCNVISASSHLITSTIIEY